MKFDFDLESIRTSNRINFVIAVCAMLVSVASFYATYLQAESAAQQVKAMTYPLIQYSSGNYDETEKQSIINLTLTNSGVGPAIVKRVEFKYAGNSYLDIGAFLKACCLEALKLLEPEIEKLPIEAQFITSPTSNIILPVNENLRMLSLLRHDANLALWDSLNKERFNLTVSACYCSLLENCYFSEAVGHVEEVENCPAP